MSVLTNIPSLQKTLSSGSDVLTDPQNPEFQELLKRWTDINREDPAAIVLPCSENDCLKTVQWALQFSVPFVTKSGGHSEWSTIGKNGVIIDLTRFSGIEVDPEARTAVLKGSVLSKTVAVALAEAGLFTALGNGNTVGAIPYFLGGGVSTTTSTTGFGSDQILGARIITAKGELLNVDDNQHPDLLWAIRGAGQFFGLVTQLTVKGHPLSLLGNDAGVIWAALFVFPIDQADKVAKAMKNLMDDSRYSTAGLIMTMAPPPKRVPSIAVSARYTGNPTDAQHAFKALYDLDPIVINGGEVPIQNTSDGREALGAKGGFKKFGIAGLRRFDIDSFLKTVDLWKELVADCPDAINTTFNFQWDSRPVKSPGFESAMSLHDIRYWQNNIVWHTDARSRSKVDEYNAKCIAIIRDADNAEYVDYQNATRDGPIEHRYRGTERLTRLKQLKEQWDPSGVFTKQLLN